MQAEPGLADTNVLVYALDADAPQHAAARALLEAARTRAGQTNCGESSGSFAVPRKAALAGELTRPSIPAIRRYAEPEPLDLTALLATAGC